MPRSPDRLQNLKKLLHAGQDLSLHEICNVLGITSKRHARRLLQQLREEGLQIKHRQDGRAKRFFLPLEYQQSEIHLVGFFQEEMLALTVASEAAQAALAETPLGTPLHSAFGKLIDRLAPEAFTFEIEDQPDRWHFGNPVISHVAPEVFQTLRRAIGMPCSVRIDYHTASTGTFSENRKINPLQLARYRGTWAVVAWCHQRRALRDFALAGIERVVICDEAEEMTVFTPPRGFDPATYYQNRFAALAGGEVYTVRLRVDVERAPYFQRKMYHPSQQVEEMDSGALEVTYEVAGLDEVRSFVQSWGVGVTVLAPPRLVAMIAEEAKILAARYAAEDTQCA